MKWLTFFFLTLALSVHAGFFDKGDESNTTSLSDLSKQASQYRTAASNEIVKVSKQADVAAAKVVEETKKAMKKYNITADEIEADLVKSSGEIKAKTEAYKTEKLLAYANKYKDLYTEKKAKVDAYAAQVKELKWKDKFSTKGKELKNNLSKYSAQLKTLTEQYHIYASKLQAMGIDLSAYGLSEKAE